MKGAQVLRGDGFFGATTRSSSRGVSSPPRGALTPRRPQHGLPVSPSPFTNLTATEKDLQVSFFPQLGLTPGTRRRHSRCISSALWSPNQRSSLAQILASCRGAAKDKEAVRVQQEHLLEEKNPPNLQGRELPRGRPTFQRKMNCFTTSLRSFSSIWVSLCSRWSINM